MDTWQRDQVENLLQGGKTLRLIAEITGLSKSALFRHRKNHPKNSRAEAPKLSGPVIYNPRAIWEREMAVRRAEQDAAFSRLEREIGQARAARLRSWNDSFGSRDL